MSEEEAHAGACGGDDGEDDEMTPGYKAPAKKDLKTIQDLDKDDDALVKYKQQLLGQTENVKDDGGSNVIVQKMLICVYNDDNTKTDIPMDLTDPTKLKGTSIEIKEGCKYSIKVQFRVQREIVCGLRYFQKIKKMGIKSKDNIMVGSYPPKTEPHIFETKPEDAPSGMMYRGNFPVASRFSDDDKNMYLEWDWTLKIVKK